MSSVTGSAWLLEFFTRLAPGLFVAWVILRLTRPLSRRICRGSMVGIVAGASAGAILAVVTMKLINWQDSPFLQRALFGPGMILGALLGSAAGSLILPSSGRRKDARPADVSDEIVDTIPRWSEAVDHLDRFKAAKLRAADPRQTLGPPEQGQPASTGSQPG